MADDERQTCPHFCLDCGHAEALHPMRGACQACSQVHDMHAPHIKYGYGNDCVECGVPLKLDFCQKFHAPPAPNPDDDLKCKECYHRAKYHKSLSCAATVQDTHSCDSRKCGCRMYYDDIVEFYRLLREEAHWAPCNTCTHSFARHSMDRNTGGHRCDGVSNGLKCTCAKYVSAPKDGGDNDGDDGPDAGGESVEGGGSQ